MNGQLMLPSHEDCSHELERCPPTWASLCVDGEHTPSDLQWCAIVSERLPDWLRGPRQDRAQHNPDWRRRIDKAKADIAAWDSEQRVRRLAELCSAEDVRTFLEAMR